MREYITRGAARPGDSARRNGRQTVHRLERTVEAVEHAVELHTHLIGERPTGVVVRALRRAARVREVIRVILRLEHVEHVGPEGLRRLHDERAGRIRLSVDREWTRRAENRDADVAQRVDELRRCREVWLVCRDDVAARVAFRRIAKNGAEELEIGAFAERRHGIADRARAGRSRRTRASTTSAAAARRLLPGGLLPSELRARAALGNRALDLR